MKFYTKYWFQTRHAISAHRLDLELLKCLKKEDSKASKAALPKMLNHLWYLNDHLIALAFFYPDVPIQTKEKMIEKLKTPKAGDRQFRAKLLDNKIEECDLSDFVSVNTSFFFETFGFNVDFLSLPLDEWDGNDKFADMKMKLKQLKLSMMQLKGVLP